MDRPVLDEVGAGSEPFVAHRAGVRPVAEVQVLMLHQDVFVAEPSLADVALIVDKTRQCVHMCEDVCVRVCMCVRACVSECVCMYVRERYFCFVSEQQYLYVVGIYKACTLFILTI